MTEFSKNSMGTGIRADLGEAGDATIDATILVASSDNTAIRGTGSSHHVTVLGAVAGQLDGIQLGDNASLDVDEHVQVGADGFVYGAAGAVTMTGAGSSLDNAGIIRGGIFGVSMVKSSIGQTFITNSGKIIGGNAAIELAGGTDEYFVHNTGLIKATLNGGIAFDASGVSSALVNLTNDGKIVGTVDLSLGGDVYDGTKGSVAGWINGFAGNDVLTGGKLADMIAGGLGADTLAGHGGADHFIFLSKDESGPTSIGRDLITDFSQSQHDKIGLHSIDANEGTVADEKFHFVQTHGFTGTAGELRYGFVNGQTLVAGDTNGDGAADFRILFDGKIHFSGADFVL